MESRKLVKEGKEDLKPDLFRYLDHRAFLIDWFSYLKREFPELSLRQIARNAGLASGYLPMILAGKRALSQEALSKLKSHLKLNRAELRYLELLRIVGESEDPDQRLGALAKLRRFESYKANHSREVELHRYLSKWFFVAIREMVLLKDFQEDPSWIHDRLRGRIAVGEIKSALAFLYENGLLEKNQDGRAQVTKKLLDCNEGVFKLSLGEFHRQILSLAENSIEQTPRSERVMRGHTAAIRMSDLEKIRDLLKETQTKIELICADATDADHVYHIELLAFPLSVQKSGEER